MRTFLVTGVTGAGKTTIAHRLRERGHHAVSLDAVPGLCAWTGGDGGPVVRPADPDPAWLEAHRWTWRADALDAVIGEHRAREVPVLWACGYAANAHHLADRFDAVFILCLGPAIMRERLRHRGGGNDFGRSTATRHAADRYRAEFDAAWRDRTTIGVDATRPVGTVVDDLLAARPARPGPAGPAVDPV